MSLEVWGDENPFDAETDALIEQGWLDPDSANELLSALKLATHHLDHMAAWISAKNQGYSFESLGKICLQFATH